MSTLTRYVIQNKDDAWVDSTNYYAIDGFFSAGKENSDIRKSQIIFRNITIPRNSTINSAYLKVTQNIEQTTTGVHTRLKGINQTLPKAITSLAEYNAFPTTVAYVDWDINSTWAAGSLQTSPDIKTIVQELVNRPDWSSGMSVGLLWDDNNSDTNNRRSVRGMDMNEGLSAPYIEIDYTSSNSQNTTLRASLSTFNALNDSNPDHYSLIADADNVLIKEHSRGTFTINHTQTIYINHNLGYIPKFYIFVALGSEVHFVYWELSPINYLYFNGEANTTSLKLYNYTGSTLTGSYFIFYDRSV